MVIKRTEKKRVVEITRKMMVQGTLEQVQVLLSASEARNGAHLWSVQELLSYRVAPAPWMATKRRGRPAKQAELDVKKQQPPGEQPPRRPLLRLGKGVLCSTTS